MYLLSQIENPYTMLCEFCFASFVSSPSVFRDSVEIIVFLLIWRYNDGILYHLKYLLENMKKCKKMDYVSTSKLMKFVEN